eukprot:1878663-Pleurochrysis_carterae.AAC.1
MNPRALELYLESLSFLLFNAQVDSETFATVDSDTFTAQGSATTAPASDKTTSRPDSILYPPPRLLADCQLAQE